jgi:hypothetical protein
MSMTISSMGGMIRPQVMSGASGRMSPSQKMSSLFDKINTSGSGTITKAQFTQAFQGLKSPSSFKAMGADAIFNQLDTKGSGSISKQDFIDGMKKLMEQMRSGAASTASRPSIQTLNNGLDALNSLGTQTDQDADGNKINYFA